MDQIDPRQRLRRQPVQQLGRITGEQADIADAIRFDLRKDLCHAVDIWLAADEACIRRIAGLRHQMLATAEADFEPGVSRPWTEEIDEAGRRRALDVKRKPRQQVLDQAGLMRAELVSFAAAVEGAAFSARGAVGRIGLVIAGRRVHRSVWYSRCKSRARGSIEEMNNCS